MPSSYENDDLRGHRFIERHTRALDLHDEVSCLLGNDGHLRSLDEPEVLEMMVHIALPPHADNLSGIAATQERQRHRLARRAHAAGPADGALHNHRIAHDDSNQC